MRFALVDDEEEELITLSGCLRELLGNNFIMEYFHSGEEFLSSFKCGDYDLVILDIYMDALLGVDVAKRIRESDGNVRIVFCTASNEFAGESYEVGARYYLRKPITAEKVKNMLDRLRLNEIELSRTMLLPDGQSIILRNITYAEYMGRMLIIHSKKREDITIRMLFSEAEKMFSEYNYFCVCSKGIIVNMYEVMSIKGDVFILTSGQSVPISRRKSKEASDAYADFRFRKLRQDGEK